MLSFPFNGNAYLSKRSGLASARCLAFEVSENNEEVIKMEKDLF